MGLYDKLTSNNKTSKSAAISDNTNKTSSLYDKLTSSNEAQSKLSKAKKEWEDSKKVASNSEKKLNPVNLAMGGLANTVKNAGDIGANLARDVVKLPVTLARNAYNLLPTKDIKETGFEKHLSNLQQNTGKDYKEQLNLDKNQGGIFDVLNLAGRPQQAIYGGVNALQKNKDIVSGVNKGLYGGEEYSGGQLLRQAGIKDSGNKVGIDDVAGLALDIVADPTNVIGGAGIIKLAKGSKIEKGVDILSDTGKVLGKLDDAGRIISDTGKAAYTIDEAKGIAKPIKVSLLDIVKPKAKTDVEDINKVVNDKAPITNKTDNIIPTTLKAKNEASLDATLPIKKNVLQDPTKEASYRTQNTIGGANNITFNANDRINNVKKTIESDKGSEIIMKADASKTKYTKDIYRNIEDVFGENADAIKKEVLEPFDKSKLDYTNFIKEKADDLRSKMDEWHIEKGSKDSELIQKFGEKKISLVDLQEMTPNWRNVVNADNYFRKQYDELIDRINASRQQIYPNVEKNIADTKKNVEQLTKEISKKKALLSTKTKTNTKLYDNLKSQIDNLEKRKQANIDLLNSEDLYRGKKILKRDDYYRHFQELSTGFKKLYNIATSPSDISSSLAGVSDYTKPSSKFTNFALRRKTDITKYDAIGGYLDYLNPASYAIHIDPNIKVFREFGKSLANKTIDYPSMNKFIEYINDFANDLAGKTNPFDRGIQKLIGRKGMAIMNWTSSRIKANSVLGNIGSSVSQVLNLPQGIADVGNPKYLAEGFKNLVKNTFTDNKIYKDSQFISERYLNVDSMFNKKILDKPKETAMWLLQAGDEASTKLIWNSEYAKAVAEKMPNPIDFADNQTRKLVAGRGIGEMTLAQKSKLVSTIMPFTVEVGNSWRVMKDFINEKEFGKLMTMFVMSNLMNKAVKSTGASGSVFDPLQAIYEASTTSDMPIEQRLGIVGGEVLGSLPMGQTMAGLYPEYGMTIGDKTTPTRKELFGKNDPTRFGTGNLFSKALENPVTGILTPWGGAQIRKSAKGIQGIVKGGVYNKSGKLQYPIEKNASNIIKGTIFGNFDESQQYYDKNRKPLSKNQTKQVDSQKSQEGIKKAYEQIIKVREYNTLVKQYKELKKQGKETKAVEKKINEIMK